jgi:serine-type D-Ala-D-Ala carboxypeptidase (penicillin-binding protein 5/6)
MMRRLQEFGVRGGTFGLVAEEPRVPSGVLTPVVRRGRRRGRARAAAFVLVAVAAAAAAVVVSRMHSSAHATPAASPRHVGPAPVALARKPVRPQPLLSTRGPVAAPRLRLAARAAIVADAGTGRVLWARRPHRRLPVASTTKIMTAVLALRALPRDALVTVPPAATRVPLVKEGLRPRERVRAWKLFYGLLLYSGNDDAAALALATAGSRNAFVARMNAEARALGLRDSHFSTPSGVIDQDNYSSAWDLAVLTRVALRDARFRAIVRRRIAHIPWSAPTYEKVYVNKNPLIGTYRGADGVKTGWTTLAGHCLVASATRGGRTVIAVVLHDANAPADARRLLNLGFRTPS